MKVVWLQNIDGSDRKCIDVIPDINDAVSAIYQWGKENNIKIPYIRMWYVEEEGRTYYDYGSWSRYITIDDKDNGQ